MKDQETIDRFDLFQDTSESINKHLYDDHLPSVTRLVTRNYTQLPIFFNLEHIYFLGGELEQRVIDGLSSFTRKTDFRLRNVISLNGESLRKRLEELDCDYDDYPITVNTLLTENMVYGDLLGVLPEQVETIDTSLSLRSEIDRSSYVLFTREVDLFPPFFSLIQLGKEPLLSSGITSIPEINSFRKKNKSTIMTGVRIPIGENFIVPYDSNVKSYFEDLRPQILDFTQYCIEKGIPSYKLFPARKFENIADRYDPKLVRKIKGF